MSNQKILPITELIGPERRSPEEQDTIESFSSIEASIRARLVAFIAALLTAKFNYHIHPFAIRMVKLTLILMFLSVFMTKLASTAFLRPSVKSSHSLR